MSAVGDSVAGIDWSITSPAICVGRFSTPWNWMDCRFYGFSHSKKQFDSVDDPRIKLYSYKDYDSEDQIKRFSNFSSWASTILYENDVEVVGLEGYAMGAHGQVFSIAESTMMMKYRLWSNDVKINVFSPTAIKKFAVGTGRADKLQMLAGFSNATHWDIKSALHETEKQKNPSSDMVDAYWICKMANDTCLSLVKPSHGIIRSK